MTTDAAGEAFFTELPVGAYKCRITVADHGEYISRFWINFWGNTLTAEMAAGSGMVNISRIFDGFDDGTKGVVNYLPWLGAQFDTSPALISRITDPANNAAVVEGKITIRGIAYAAAGVERVEVSLDNGQTWDEAVFDPLWVGKSLWSFTTDYLGHGNFTVLSRVIDQDGAVESPAAPVTLTVDNSATTVIGSITADQTWSGSVNIQGDVTVAKGVTLTILPGTTVSFPTLRDAAFGGSNASKSELIVNGTLIAEGHPRAGDHLYFHPDGAAER